MPRVTAYIRDADMELWLAVPNKAELISRALHSDPKLMKKAVSNEFPGNSRKEEIASKEVAETQRVPSRPIQEQPCCTNAAPCKHWSWDGDKQVWKNQLSGREKDA